MRTACCNNVTHIVAERSSRLHSLDAAMMEPLGLDVVNHGSQTNGQ
jgi:hypothetical protein